MNTLSEIIIAKHARSIRNIQQKQIEPHEKIIEQELLRLFPFLLKREKGKDDATDWTCDIVSCSSDDEVISTIERIREIQTEKEINNGWTCRYCGKNTYDVDCDYLFGVDHISCVLEEESKKEEPLNTVDQIRNQMARMQDYITQLETRLNQLETHYNEPSN